MKKRHLFLSCVLVALLFMGCGSEFDDPVDCSERCGERCGAAGSFDYESYEGSCVAREERDFCGTSVASADCVEPEFEVEERSVAEIQGALLAGEISCEWLVGRYIERILWHDLRMAGGAPPLNSFVTLNEGALKTAQRLDAYQHCEGELVGPLHCAPFVIKTSYASKEVPVTAGTLALKDAQPDYDSFSVKQLREAGAVMMGSTTMDELARGASSINGRSGKTGNAYNPRYNSGGSSSGAAVAVAANFAAAGLGTDNCASLTVPASFNGLVTIRPSHGLVSMEGIFPSNKLDGVAGPMARTVEDLAAFFTTMARFNPQDRDHCAEEMPRVEDYRQRLKADGLEGKRIGVLREIPQGERAPFGSARAEVEALYQAFLEELHMQGAQIIDDVELPGLPVERSSSGMGREVERYLARTSGGASSVKELCESEAYSYSSYESVRACKRSMSRSDRELRRRLDDGIELYESNRAYVEQVMDDLGVDALVYPVEVGGAPRVSGVNSNCILASVTGLPTMVVPAGFTQAGLPVGMSLTGRFYEEGALFEMAYAYEQATGHRRRPQMEEIIGEPPLDIAAFNRVHLELGQAAFDEVLRDQEDRELTATVFADIARRVLEANGLEELLD